MKTEELCDCGQALHYPRAQTRAQVEFLIALFGPTTTVVTQEGSWKVPRHYIALHGIKATEIPFLARKYNWEEVTND